MKFFWRPLLLLLALLPWQAAHPCNGTDCVDAEVVRIVDGDTIKVRGNFGSGPAEMRVRLTDIDAPERGQPWGAKATQALENKIAGRQVRIASAGEDDYGRLLGRVFVGDRDINYEMVREGHAWVYRKRSPDAGLIECEQLARDERAGLWGQPDPCAPWDSRRGTCQPKAALASTDQAFQCGAKTYCGQMTSCKEALFFLKQCNLWRIDGDGDGTPCERLCNDRTIGRELSQAVN